MKPFADNPSSSSIRRQENYAPSLTSGSQLSTLNSQLPLLVIGYGNELRGDDAAGPEVARSIAELQLPGVEVLVRPILTPELADNVAQAATVIFVDAGM